MARWLRSLGLEKPLSAKKALSGLDSEPRDTNPAKPGVMLLENSRVESEELGPLAKLPPFAPVVVRLLRLFDEDDVDQLEIVRLVEADPALTGEILGVVNSPLYAIRGKVSSPAHGVAMLGVTQMRALATTLAMRTLISGSPKMSVVRRFWKHSVATAAIAQELGPRFGVEKGLGYTAAMVHDLGRIGLLAAHGQAYDALAAIVHASADEVLEAECTQFGMDHCKAGLLLSRAWGLPEPLQGAIAHHHGQGSDAKLVALIQLCCRMAHAFQFQSILDRDERTPGDIVQALVPEMHEELAERLENLKTAAVKMIDSFEF